MAEQTAEASEGRTTEAREAGRTIVIMFNPSALVEFRRRQFNEEIVRLPHRQVGGGGAGYDGNRVVRGHDWKWNVLKELEARRSSSRNSRYSESDDHLWKGGSETAAGVEEVGDRLIEWPPTFLHKLFREVV